MSLDFKNKKVVIFGLGSYKYGSGISAAKFFIRYGAEIVITDMKTEKELKSAVSEIKKFAKKHKSSLKFVLGKHREADFKNADIVIRNPGVRADHPLLKLASNSGAAIHTDVSLFLKFLQPTTPNGKAIEDPRQGWDYNLQPKVIGITGTRGKSTTSALLAKILKEAGKTVFLGGNLGYSPLNFIDEILKKARKHGSTEARKQGSIEAIKQENMKAQKQIYVILEMSSWMTESLSPWKISPPYALVTNIYPDHLNTYDSMKDYVKAKAVIFKYQKPGDILILNRDNKITRQYAKQAKSKVIWFSKNDIRGHWRELPRKSALAGEHNALNIAAARAMAKILGVSDQSIWRAVKKFRGLPGRLELVRKLRGIKFYNDTTATMPEATIQALKTLGRRQLPATSYQLPAKNIILIAGGADKKLDYKELAKEIPKYVKTLILFKGDASNKIISGVRCRASGVGRQVSGVRCRASGVGRFKNIGNMREAVRLARKSAKRGDIILLSPAAASFNMFQNEVARGEQFIRAIKNLK